MEITSKLWSIFERIKRQKRFDKFPLHLLCNLRFNELPMSKLMVNKEEIVGEIFIYKDIAYENKGNQSQTIKIILIININILPERP